MINQMLIERHVSSPNVTLKFLPAASGWSDLFLMFFPIFLNSTPKMLSLNYQQYSQPLLLAVQLLYFKDLGVN